MKKLAALALLGLAGCATVGETMTTKEPSDVFATAKTPAQYRDCVIDAQEVAGITATERGEGYLFVFMRASGQVFTVMPTAEGSEVKVWGLLGTRRAARQCA